MQHFNVIDWAVILGYLVAIIAFGLRFGKGLTNTKDYFLGSQSIPWWAVGLSIVATETSAVTFIAIPAASYGGDLSFLQIVLGYVLARIVLAIFLVPYYFRKEVYSPYQMVGNTFGPSARHTVACFFLIAGTLAAGVRVYVTCIPLQLMLGIDESQIIIAIVLFVGLSLIYTYVGGVKAVIWTDAAQFFAFTLGGLFVVFYVPTLIDGGISATLSEASEGGKLQWFNSGFVADGYFSETVKNIFTGPTNIWMGMIGATFMVMATHGADQLIVQRVLSCGNVGDGRRALALSALIILPMFLLFLLVGVVLWVYYQHFPNLPIELPEPQPGVKKNDYLFPIFILTQIPSGMKGFLVVGILCAAMSSVSSALSALSSVSTIDLFKSLTRGKKSEATYLRVSKLSTIAWGAVLVLVAWWTQKTTSVLNTAFALSGLTTGALLGGLLLSLLWKTGSAVPVICGMIGSFGVMLGIKINGVIPWPWYTLIGSSIVFIVAFGVRFAMNLTSKSEVT